MAFYGVPSTGAALSASSGNDTVRLGPTQTLLTAATVYGLDGNDLIDLAAIGKSATFVLTATGTTIDTGALAFSSVAIGSSTYAYGTGKAAAVTGAFIAIATTGIVATAQKAVRKIGDAQLFGNVGNDTIIFGESLTGFGSSSLGGGAGDDVIGNYTNVGGVLTGGSDLSLVTSEGVTLEGGGGNDTLRLVDAGSVTYRNFGFNGGQGDDNVTLSVVGGTALASTIGGGGGNDTIQATVKLLTAATIAGGGGDDTVAFTLSAAQGSFIGGDNGNMSLNDYDGADLLSGSIVNGSGNTVFAGGGNDTLNLNLSGLDNDRIALNGGNDSLTLTGQLKGLTVEAGAGDDSVTIAETGISASYTLGGGNDSITFSMGVSGAAVSASTVFGGLGADIVNASEGNSAAAYGLTFGYNSYADSTAAGFDSIQVGDGSGDIYTALFVGGGITRASNFNATNFTGVDGQVTFSANTFQDLTSRIVAIDGQVTTTGAAVTFADQSNNKYLFIQGGTDDLVVRFGSAAGAGAQTTLTVAAAGTNSILTVGT